MAKNWKHTKKLLEDLLCDKLKGRITYQLHCYRALTMIGQAILRSCWIKNRFLEPAAALQKIRTTASTCLKRKSAIS